MTTSIWQADDTQPVREVDILVVGAGLAGCAASYFLQQAGREVVITEKADVALGASGRNAGFMITGLDTYYHEAINRYGEANARDLWQVSERSIAFWKQIIHESGTVPFQQIGSMLLAESETEAEDIAQAARAMQADGFNVIFHAGDPLKRGYLAGLENPSDGAVHPYELTQAVLSLSGAELIANNELYRIEQTRPDQVTVYTRRLVFRAQYVLLCTNAYSPHVDPYFVGKVIPTRAQALVTEPLPQPVIATCGYSDYGYMYYRMTFDGRFLLGGGRNRHLELEANTTEDILSHPVQRTLDEYLATRFPDIRVPVARRWGGIMGFSVDGVPLVGTLPDKPRVGFAVGFTGHGLSMGAETARRAVRLLLTGEHAGAVDAGRLAQTTPAQ